MTIPIPKSDSVNSPGPNNGRRSFIWKAGAAMSAVAAAAVTGFSKPGNDTDTGLKNRIGMLEDANSIRRLHQSYESLLDRGMYEEVVDMFTDSGEVIFHGGVFSGKNSGIRRLYCSLFRSGLTGRKMVPAPGLQGNPEQQQDIVEVALDRKSALGHFPYSMQVGTLMTGDSSLVQMARLQGEGIIKRWEGGIHEVSCVKAGNAWKISRLDYRAESNADFKPGRTYAKPADIPAFTKVFPEDPFGPDKLV